MAKYKLDHLLKSLDKLFRSYGIIVILSIYFLKVYGSLLAYHEGLISSLMWGNIHFTGVQLILLMFMVFIKDNINKLTFSLGMGLFTSRLINQLVFKGFELWYEIPAILIFTTLFYYIQKFYGKEK